MNDDREVNAFETLAGWKLLRVDSSGRVLWLCAVTPEVSTYVYIPDSGRFHLNDGVYTDYVWDRENAYSAVSVAEARGLIESAVGRLPSDLPGELRAQLLTDEQIAVDDVFRHVEAS